MFIYAWTSSPSVPWIAPAIGITVGAHHFRENFLQPWLDLRMGNVYHIPCGIHILSWLVRDSVPFDS